MDKLSITLQNIKRNFNEERDLLQNTIDRLRNDYNNLAKTNSASKALSDKKFKSLFEKLDKQERVIEDKDHEMMRMSIDFAKIKSEVAMTAKYTDLSSHSARKRINLDQAKNDGAKCYFDRLSKHDNEIELEDLYAMLNEESGTLSPKY